MDEILFHVESSSTVWSVSLSAHSLFLFEKEIKQLILLIFFIYVVFCANLYTDFYHYLVISSSVLHCELTKTSSFEMNSAHQQKYFNYLLLHCCHSAQLSQKSL